jgi:non-homologous end joining protein Ku
MSRQEKFELKFPSGGLTVHIRIKKATEAKESFCQTVEGRPVRTVRILAKDDVKANSVEDIEKVLPWFGGDSTYKYHDEDGLEQMLIIDKTIMDKLFMKSATMTIIGFIDQRAISPRMYDGYHYFMELQVDSKSKTTSINDRQAYSILHGVCVIENKCILVKYVSGDREKFATVYPDGDKLMMSNIIHQNYQREGSEIIREQIPDVAQYAKALLSKFALRELDKNILFDQYELKLKEYITSLKLNTGQCAPTKPAFEPINKEADFLSKLLML